MANQSVYFVIHEDDTVSRSSRGRMGVSVKGSSVDKPKQRSVDDDDNSSDEISSVSLEEDWAERETWTGRLDFLLSCIGFAVGLGNIWRFPYLCYVSGGGAFLIPYTLFLLTCGLPMFFMEVSFGQFASLSPLTIWRVCPLFKGVGYGMVIVSGIVCIYYNIIVTWNFYFLFQSMRSVLPWTRCDGYWNTDACVHPSADHNETVQASKLNETMGTSSEEFWRNNVLEMTSGIENMGTIRWPLLGCLLLAWTCVFLCLCKGVKSSGRVVYVTATFPYIVLSILLVRGLMLPGAAKGIKFYLIPEWDKLTDFKVWGDAAVQIFYSIGFAWGSLITMSSYNKFNNNVFKDAMIVPFVNCATSIFAGFVIFSVLGFMSHQTGTELHEVAGSGPGLIFVVYPQAVSMMPLPQLWAILFFLMVFTVGLDSQFGMFETITSAFIDEYPHILRKKKTLLTLFLCGVEFALGIPMVLQGGIYLLTVVDWYASAFSVMVLSLSECLVLSWIYGVDRFRMDIGLMLGHQPSLFWKIMWKYVTPGVILFVLFFAAHAMKDVTLGSYTYPGWAVGLGWCLTFVSLIPLPICAICALSVGTEPLKQRIRILIQPCENWGPASLQNRQKYIESLTGTDLDRYEASLMMTDRQTYCEAIRRDSLLAETTALPEILEDPKLYEMPEATKPETNSSPEDKGKEE